MTRPRSPSPRRTRACPQCDAITRAGHRCKRRTCKFAPKCRQHSPVEVRPSPIAGRGLFAKRKLRKNERVADYTMGVPLTRAQFLEAYPGGRATHVWRHPNGMHYDLTDVRLSVAGMVNRAKRPNARITGGGKLQTRRAVPADAELTVAYGPAYRLR
jgi:hypothetical protein